MAGRRKELADPLDIAKLPVAVWMTAACQFFAITMQGIRLVFQQPPHRSITNDVLLFG